MSFIDARNLPDGSSIDADLVIVGAGMAGISLAREWAGADLTVAVLESGGRDADPQIQDLYGGSGTLSAPGHDTRRIDDYLKGSRRRALGGSGAIWGGKCAPLDEADFAARSWLPRTGWPMTRASLKPFYDRACAHLEIAPFGQDYDSDPEPGRPALRVGERHEFFSAPRRFSRVSGVANPEAFNRYRTDFAAAANIQVYLHANVAEIGVGKDGRSVTRLDLACLNGRRHSARGRAYVLATGGIENARLLLASTATRPEGVGNANDQVGRCFQGHVTYGVLVSPEGLVSSLSVSDPQSMSLYTDSASRTHCVLTVALAGQRRFGIGNFTTTLFGPVPSEREDVNAILELSGRIDAGSGPETARNFLCYFMSEQLPNAESRVTLDTQNVDALGMPRVRLAWRFTSQDLDRLERAITALAAAMGAHSKGRVCWPVAHEKLVSILDPSRHHIGTTRMDRDPSRGVVDTDCRVHGMSDLYIAGSSVFPTSGLADPTLTLIALAMRLSDTLKRQLGGRG